MATPGIPRWALELMTEKERRDWCIAMAIANGSSVTQAAAKAKITSKTVYKRQIHLMAREIQARRDAKSQAKAG